MRRIATAFAILVLLATRSSAEDKVAEEVKKLQGTWESVTRYADGTTQRWVKVVGGNKDTVSIYDGQEKLLHAHTSDFRVEPSGKVWIFTYSNFTVTIGPDKGQKHPEPVSYVYRCEGDTFTEAHGLLPGDLQEPSVMVWKRVKEKSARGTSANVITLAQQGTPAP